MGLAGKVAIVTGASSGIGEATARKFAREGVKVVVAARRRERLDKLVAELGGDALAITADVTKEADVERLFAETVKRFGHVDLAVNNAGVADSTPIEELSLARWEELMAINITSVFLCCRAALALMTPRGKGRIINIGSLSARVPREKSPAYTASKFALEGFTRALALDARESGVTVCIVHPGSTITELIPGMGGRPATRSMKAETVAEVIACVASLPDEANMLDTTVLPIAQPFLGRG